MQLGIANVIVTKFKNNTVTIPDYMPELYEKYTGIPLSQEELDYNIEASCLPEAYDEISISDNELSQRTLFMLTKFIEDKRRGYI